MSRKRKKKYNGHQQKQLEAERKNAYYKSLKHIFSQAGCVEVYHILPRNVRKILFENRIRSLRVCFENCDFLPARTAKLIGASLDNECRIVKVEIDKAGNTISLKNFYSIGFMLIALQDWLKEDPFPDAERALKLMLEKLKLREAEDFARREIVLISMIASLYYSDLRKHMVWVGHEFKDGTLESLSEGLHFKVVVHNAESKKFVFDGHPRPAFRVGSFVLVSDSCWCSVPRSMFEKPSPFNHLPIPVYIQSHAINRLEERLDCVDKIFIQGYIYTSFINPKVIHFNGKYLVEYIFGNKKVGYLVAEVVDNAVLIKTFLFLTNSGTPEGQKLSQLSGLTKADSKYLNIDRLSTFKQSDICENEELKNLFVLSGCKCLFELELVLYEQAKARKIAERMLKYMQLEEVVG